MVNLKKNKIKNKTTQKEKKIIKSSKIKKSLSIKSLTKKIIHGDTLQTLKKLPSKSVNLIITSPSYMLGKEYDHERTFEDYKEYQKPE